MAAFEVLMKYLVSNKPLTQDSLEHLMVIARKEQEALYAKIKKYEAKKPIQIKMIEGNDIDVNEWLMANKDKTIISITTSPQYVSTDRDFYYTTTIVYEEEVK